LLFLEYLMDILKNKSGDKSLLCGIPAEIEK